MPVYGPEQMREQQRSGMPVSEPDATAGRKTSHKARRPAMAINLPTIVVGKLTELLFADSGRPRIRVRTDELERAPLPEPGDQGQDADPPEQASGQDALTPDQEQAKLIADTVSRLLDEIELWANMVEARGHGGSMGSACVVGTMRDGVPALEVWDPRWVRPYFLDPDETELDRIEQRYIETREEWDENRQCYREVAFWHRREINRFWDIVWNPVPVPEKGKRITWTVASIYYHGLRFCPAVWIRNTRDVRNGFDGAPDMPDVALESTQQVDMLVSEGTTVIRRNADPIPAITLGDKDQRTDEIKMSSDDPIVLTKGGTVSQLSYDAAAAKAAIEVAEKLMRWIARGASVVIDHPPAGTVTATEIRLWYSAMYHKAGILRHAWGRHGAHKVAVMIVRYLVTYHERTTAELEPPPEAMTMLPEGTEPPNRPQGLYRLLIPGAPPGGLDALVEHLRPDPADLDDNDADNDGTADADAFAIVALAIRQRARAMVEIDWPDRFHELSLGDVQTATTAAAAAVAAKLITRKEAILWLAPYFSVLHPDRMVKELEQQAEQALQTSMMQFARADNDQGDAGSPDGGQDDQDDQNGDSDQDDDPGDDSDVDDDDE